MTLQHGDKVKCLRGNIDRGHGAGAVGYVTGFARLSVYHGREVYVSDTEGSPTERWCGWFWIGDVEKLED